MYSISLYYIIHTYMNIKHIPFIRRSNCYQISTRHLFWNIVVSRPRVQRNIFFSRNSTVFTNVIHFIYKSVCQYESFGTRSSKRKFIVGEFCCFIAVGISTVFFFFILLDDLLHNFIFFISWPKIVLFYNINFKMKVLEFIWLTLT